MIIPIDYARIRNYLLQLYLQYVFIDFSCCLVVKNTTHKIILNGFQKIRFDFLIINPFVLRYQIRVMDSNERYNRQKVNSHLVVISKPKEVSGLKYYDFSTEKWRPVKPFDNLPYGLCSFQFTDEIPKDPEKCVVTCHDSYRLSSNPDNEPDNKGMKKEREWREAIVKKGAEMEYSVFKKEKVYRAKGVGLNPTLSLG